MKLIIYIVALALLSGCVSSVNVSPNQVGLGGNGYNINTSTYATNTNFSLGGTRFNFLIPH